MRTLRGVGARHRARGGPGWQGSTMVRRADGLPRAVAVTRAVACGLGRSRRLRSGRQAPNIPDELRASVQSMFLSGFRRAGGSNPTRSGNVGRIVPTAGTHASGWLEAPTGTGLV